MTTIAGRVIEKCGGHKVVAEWLGLSVTSVYRFTYSKERGGSGGLIPAEHQQVILEKAKERDIELSPSDFFNDQAIAPPSSDEPEPPEEFKEAS